MTAYYNEIDPYAAQWLRNLIKAGQIAAGDVDERSIVDVRADDLRGYAQCHFFAGIGGWSIALRLAGWPDDRSVWTGSCPCQPFSAAGAGKAADDERHMWPAWLPLIQERRPATVFGEQVDAAVGWGWIDAVFADLEAAGYACGTTVLPACSVGAPHVRKRLWFLANANGGDASAEGIQRGWQHGQQPKNGRSGELADTGDPGHRSFEHTTPGRREPVRDCKLDNSISDGRRARRDDHGKYERIVSHTDGFWRAAQFIHCTDGKARPVEPGTFPLAHGVQRRTSKLRAYGNAIVPQVAAEFIMASDSGGC